MSKFAELPDGTQLEFPDDTDESIITQTVKKHLGVSASLADQIPGLQPVGTPKEHTIPEKILGGVEAGANVISGLVGSLAALPVGSAQDMLDGTFSSHGPGPKASQYSEALTYEPGTDLGKEYAEKANYQIGRYLPGLIPAMPQMAARDTAKGIHKRFAPKGVTPTPAPDADVAAFAKQREVQPKPIAYENGLTYDGPGLASEPILRATPQEALKTTHDYPTVDFPLRQEVLEQPEIKSAIDNFRQQAAELEQVANNAINPKVREKAASDLKALKDEFGAGMEQMGIRNAQDAYGRGLYEARGDQTTGQVKHTFAPKRQRGMLNIGDLLPESFIEKTREIVDKFGDKFDIDFVKGRVSSDFRNSVGKTSESLGLEANKADHTLTITDKSGKPVGYLELSKGPDGKLQPEMIRVRDDLKGGGIGTELIKAAEELGPLERTYNETSAGKGLADSYEKSKAIGQAKVARGERGSIGFFGKDEFTKYSDKIKSNFPDATDAEIQKAWQAKQEASKTVDQQVAKADKLQDMSKISPAFLDMWRDQHTNESAIDAIKNSPDNSNTSTGVWGGLFSSKGRLGVQTHKNDGIRMAVSRMVTILDENKILSNGELNNQESGVLPVLRQLETLVGEGDAAAVFKYILNKQLDANYETTLTRQQKLAVDRIKATTDKTWDIIIDQYKQLDPERAQVLEGLKQEWYLPHRWNGDFVTYIRTKEGKLVTFVSEYTKAEAEKAAAYYREALGDEYVINDPAYIGSKATQISKSAARRIGNADLQEAFAGKMEALIELLSSTDPEVQKAQKAVQSVINRKARNAEEMNQRLKVNTEVGGFLGNKPWKSARDNYFEAKDSFESYVEGVYNWKSAMEMAKFLAEVKDAAPDKINTYATLVNEFKAMSGLDRSPTNPAIQTLAKGFAETTGLSPKYVNDVVHSASNLATGLQTGVWNIIMGIQNLVQAGSTSVNLGGVLAAHGGSLNPVTLASHILKASMEASFGEKFRKADYDYATAHEINKLGLLESHAKTKGGSIAKDWGINKLTQQTESVSRLAVFYGITDYLVESGLSKPEALEISKNLTRDYMVNYEQYARPGVTTQTGIVGNSFGRLQTFAANSFTQFVQSGLYGLKGIKETNPRLFLPLAAFMATSVLTAGINGTIPMDVAEKLFNAGQLAGVIPPDWRSPRQYMFEEYPHAAVGPLSSITGKYLDPSFRSTIPYLGLPPVWGILGTRISDAVSGIKWGINAVQGLDTSQATKYKAINSFTPTGWRGIPEQQFMVDKENSRYFSPNTELPTYTGKESPTTKFTNLRSLARGTTNELGFLETNREKRIKEATDNINKDLQKYVNGQMRANQPISEDIVVKAIGDTIKLGGDPEATVQQMTKLTELSGYDNQLIIGVIKNVEKNPFRAKRLLDTYNSLQTINGTK